MRIAVVTPTMLSGERGGAEALYEGLVRNLRRASYDVDHVEVVVDESHFDAVLASYARCYDLDLSDYDLVISTKAPTYMVRHHNHVSYLLHTLRVFYDMFEREYGAGTPTQHEQRRLIHALDRKGLHPSRVRKHLANGHQTFHRLYEADPFWREVGFQAVHHPSALEGYKEPRRGAYVFLPSRLHRWKRADLVINAFKYLDRNVKLKIAGTGEDEAALRELAGDDPRIEFLGRVSDAQMLDLYAGALVVPFVPVLEDYGLVTIEAFKARKPVITCTDSGEPTHFVRDYETGFVVEPEPRAIAERLTYMIDHSNHAAVMGQQGFARVQHINWETIIQTLVQPDARHTGVHSLAPATVPLRVGDHAHATNGNGHTANGHATNGNGHITNGHATKNGHCTTPVKNIAETAGVIQETTDTCRVAVLDMQPIDPPIGGGRMRLFGLYHGLGAKMPTTYIGTYDWPGPGYRRHHLSPTLEEIDVPLSDAHFKAAAEWQELAGGKGVIDVAFDLQAHHSPDYVTAAKTAVLEADIVVFSHPWIYPLVKDELRRHSPLVVYDSQNVEGILRMSLLDDEGFGTDMVKHVVEVEHELCHRADLILACSHQERVLFHDLYSVPYSKILVAPNGTFTERTQPADENVRREAKQSLHLGAGPVAIFLGSAYGPNHEAADYICTTIAPALPHVTFAICGDVGPTLDPALVGHNVRITGRLEDAKKATYFAAADVAINPISSGGGTNVKMFDYMAAALPIVSSPTGARGISQGSHEAFVVCQPHEFSAAICRVVEDSDYAARLHAGARALAAEKYSWERISSSLGARLYRAWQTQKQRPFFTVAIPSYERHDDLRQLIDRLHCQTCRDFEVVIVDQSAVPWQDCPHYPDMDIVYIHTDVKGAVSARNTAAYHAQGEIIAFTDDDCQPLPDWLENARNYFDDPQVVGVEGLIISDRRDDPNYRAVTNEGFEGIGFMTANLMVRRETFVALDGFDDRFDHPHFREDTDLGWRAQELGQFPFAHDVCIYHPPHLRDSAREGLAERNRFFEKDALLMQKHPDRYRKLFKDEGHFLHTPGFRENFLRGAEKYGVEVDDYYLSLFLTASSTVGGR